MTRLQILELPTNIVGDYATTPFVLVIDDTGQLDQDEAEAMQNAKDIVGAAGVLVFPEPVEIVTR